MSQNYLLLTAAKNEEAFIENTLKSVINQTVLPIKWIIVNDCSIDRTDEIIKSYSSRYSFIELISKLSGGGRNFGSKAEAVMLAYSEVKHLDFEYIGNLDADISFESDYYENILKKFKTDDNLGIAGGVRFDFYKDHFIKVRCAQDSVGGPFQLFRQQCFEQVGGYLPLKYGGIDIVAEVSAKMRGWKVKSYPEFVLYHHRYTGTGGDTFIKNHINLGYKLYSLGYKLTSAAFKSFRRGLQKPLGFGGMIIICGYLWASASRYKKLVSDDFISYLNKEQKRKIISSVKKRFFNID